MRYKNYINSHSKSNRIYSRDEVLDMPLRRIRDNKLELESQYRSIGVPTTESLRSSENVVWVEEYTRDDGTKVSGHWRSKPDGSNIADPMRSILPQNNGSKWEMNMTGDAADGNSSENPIQSILSTIMEILRLNSQDSSNNVEEGALTGGAAGVKDVIKSKVLEHANQDFDKANPNMTLEEKAVYKILTRLASPFYPMSSNSTINGMQDMEAARHEYDVKVNENLSSLDNAKERDVLKKMGANDSDSGAVYGTHSDVSKSFEDSPELEAYLTSVREDVLAGRPLKDTSLYYGAEKGDKFNNQSRYDRHTFARKITLIDPKVDENGVFTGTLVDYSDFKNEPVKDIATYCNKWGYKMQEKGYYKNHYQIIRIRKKVRW